MKDKELFNSGGYYFNGAQINKNNNRLLRALRRRPFISGQKLRDAEAKIE